MDTASAIQFLDLMISKIESGIGVFWSGVSSVFMPQNSTWSYFNNVG